MLNMMELWTSGLTILIAVIAYMMNEKFTELARIGILLNKTREEVAKKSAPEKKRSGGTVGSASKRADGIATKGKTRGRMV